MTDRLVSSVLGKYLSVFIKNWGKDALSLSFMKGTGALTNLLVNEQVIQEVMGIDFLQVMDAHVNQLSIRLPGLTRLTNDPITLTLDRLVINVEEPLKPIPKKTPLKDFLEKNRGSDEGGKNGTKKYGLVDRIIDGVKIVVNWVEINVKTLGPYPSTQIGAHSPHVLQVLVKGFVLQTTDYRFKPVTNLKDAIQPNSKNPFVWIHRLGTVDSISVSLIPRASFVPSNINTMPGMSKKPSNNNMANTFLPNSEPIRLLNDINLQIFITMKKRTVTFGKQSSMLSLNAEIVLPKIAITLRQEDIQSLIRVLLAFKIASGREDLKQPKETLSSFVKQTKPKRSNSHTSLSSRTSGTATGSSRQSKAISKFFVDSKDNGEEELSDDEEKLEEELADLESDIGDMEIINDEYLKKSADIGEASRKTIVVNLNEFYMTFLYSRDESNQPKQVAGRENKRVLGYFFEMLGFQLGVVMPEDVPEDKNIQLSIPFIQFKEITTSFKAQGNLTDTATTFLDLELLCNNNTTDNELTDENYIIQPQIFRDLYEEDEIMSHDTYTSYSTNNQAVGYTVNLEIWPEFLSTHRYYPDYTATERVFRPGNSVLKRKLFEDGKEMIRFKFVKGEGMDFVLECRVNPIQVMLDVRRLIRILEYSLGCLPDMSIRPPEDTLIHFASPTKVPSSSTSSLSLSTKGNDAMKGSSSSLHSSTSFTDDSDEEETSFVFLVEIRSPKFYIPSNYSTEIAADISEMLCIDSKELIITSDPRIKKQSEWAKKDLDSLFSPKVKDKFPSAADDFSSMHATLWEVLPHKFKVKLSDFIIQIMPSIHSPPQRIMEPLSLTFDLGINDETISYNHAKLPKIVLLTFIENLNFHLNQSQVILLLEFARTFIDDPPMVQKLLLQSTKSFHDHNIHLFKKANEPIEAPKEDIRLIPLMFMSKIAKLEVSITASSATSMESFFSSKYDPSMDAKLLTILLSEAEVLVETNNITKASNFLTVKSKISHFEITSPQNGENPSAIMVSHKHSDISMKSNYVFPMEKKEKPSTARHMIVFRYEQPIDLTPSDKSSTPIDSQLLAEMSPEPHVNLTYLRNPRLIMRINGIHIGLNTDTAYHVFHFLNSRENAFDISPMEIMNRTVKRTYKKIREKYLPEKKKAEEVSELPQDFLPDTISPRKGEEFTPVMERTDVKTFTEPTVDVGATPISGKVSTPMSPLTDESMETSDDEDHAVFDAVTGPPEDDGFEIITSPGNSKSVSKTASPAEPPILERPIETAIPQRKPKENTNELIPVIKEELIPVIKGELIPAIKTVAKKIKDVKKKDTNTEESDEEEQDEDAKKAYLATTFKTFYPMLFDVSIDDIEVYIIGKGKSPNAAGVEIKKLGVTHVPSKTLIENQSLINDEFSIEGLTRNSTEQVQSFSNRSHEYELKLYGCGTNVHCLIRNDIPFKSFDDIIQSEQEKQGENLQVVPLTSAPVDFLLGLVNDYTKPLSKRGIWFQALDPSLGVHPNNSLRLEIKPEMVYVISKLLRSQFKDLKQWADMLQGYFAMFADKKTLQIIKKFQNLGELIGEAQRSFTKTLVEHYSLARSVTNMQTELNDKTDALNQAIQSKIHLTEVLAEMQNQQSLIQTPAKQTTPVKQQPKVEDNKKTILIEGPCKVLTHNSDDWKKVHCVLLDTCEILCLTQKVPATSFVKDSTSAIDKYLFYQMPLKDTTEAIKTSAPVDDNPLPKEVYAIINGSEKRLFIYPETPNQIKEWVRLSSRTIEELRLKNMRLDISVQTDITREFFEKKDDMEDLKEQIANKMSAESTESQIRELRNMQKQFETIKSCLSLAAEEEFSLRIEFSQLHEYIQTFRNEQEKREESISQFLQQESETRVLLKQQTTISKQLQLENDFKEIKIRELDAKLKEEKRRFKKAQEETNSLHRTLREHIIQLQQDLQKTQIDKTKIEKEYNVLVKRQIQQTERALKIEKKNDTSQVVKGEISDQQLVNTELKNIISDLYVQLAELKDQNQKLQMENMELRSQRATSLEKEEESTDVPEIKLETVLDYDSKIRGNTPVDDDSRKPLPHVPLKTLPKLPQQPPQPLRPELQGRIGSMGGPPNNQPSQPTSLRDRGASFADKLKNRLTDTLNKL